MAADTDLVPVVRSDSRVDALRIRLAAARHRTRLAVLALRVELPAEVGIRPLFRAHTGVILALAFTAGFLLARRR